MDIKALQDRWYNNDTNNIALNKILKITCSGGVLSEDHSPFNLTENNYIDFRGIDFSKLKLNNITIENADLSYCVFNTTWIEKSVFKNVEFEKTDFSMMSERGNRFIGTKFLKCKLNKAGIGYLGSEYKDCVFNNVVFTKAIFIRGEFNSCEFVNCQIKNIDFNASSFDNCYFSGTLKSVWFRGDYAFESDKKHFGKARKNKMRNVSFKGANLIDVNFSNDCDLSTIQKPESGNYYLINNWKQKLNTLRTIISKWPSEERKEAEIFLNSYLIHAHNQYWFLINIDEIKNEFGSKLGSKIIDLLIK